MTRTAKKRKVDALVSAAEKRWGKGVIVLGSDPRWEIQRIPCGVESVDDLLGGGFPRNRYTEIYGNFGIGKTYLAHRLIANAQALGGKCAFIAAEGFDSGFARMAGVDLRKLKVHPQRSGHRCVDVMELMLRSGEYDVIALDSTASLVPQSEVESSMEAADMGTAQAKMMSKALRKLTVANRNTALIFINQLREAIGTVFGNRDITPGGRAMGFYAGIRLELVRIETLKKTTKVVDLKTGADKVDKIVTGHRVLMRVSKDKTGGRPYATGTFVFSYAKGGIDPIEDLLYLGRKYGVVSKATSHWWVDGYEDEAADSRGRFKAWLRRNAAVQEDLLEMIKEARDGRAQDEAESDDADDAAGGSD